MYDIHTDQLNTPRVVTDKNGTVVWRWDSAPFGEDLPDENPGHSGTENDFALNLRFPGQYYDKETNLHYNYFRDYDPKTGQYTQSDPLGLLAGINTYAYVDGNPLTIADPYGLFGWADMPTLPQEVVDYSAGLGDSLLWGFGDDLRDAFDIVSVDRCSRSYNAGSWTGIGVSGARGVYAGAVKAGSVVAATGVGASNWRNTVKIIFRGGIGKNWRKPNLSKYKTDADLRRAAGHSNPFVNMFAAGVGFGGAKDLCGCDK